MGTAEESSLTKSTKPGSPIAASTTPTMPAYPDWASSVQPLYGAGAAVASPASHPYWWGSQHPLMAPYGAPVPYPAVYPLGGVYAHPNIALMPGAVNGISESETKSYDQNERAKKKSKRLSITHVGKSGDSENAASGSANDAATQSAESGSEGSSEGSENNNNQEHSVAKKGNFEKMVADGANAHSNGVLTNYQAAMTNLHIGMDSWTNSGMNEREIKREKRKQSNRESARKSRLKKQVEHEDLQQRVKELINENDALRDELQRLSEACEKLHSENNAIKEELKLARCVKSEEAKRVGV